MKIKIREHVTPMPAQISIAKKAPEGLSKITGICGDSLKFIELDDEGSLWIYPQLAEKFATLLAEKIGSEKTTFFEKYIKNSDELINRLYEISKKCAAVSEEKFDEEKYCKVLKKWFDTMGRYVSIPYSTKVVPKIIKGMIDRKEGFENLDEDERSILMTPQRNRTKEQFIGLLKLSIHLKQNKKFDAECTDDKFPILDDFIKEYGYIGPREWEAPGYNDKCFLMSMIKAYFSKTSVKDDMIRLEELNSLESEKRKLRESALAKLDKRTVELFGFLWWLEEKLEEESEIPRRAFYTGALKLYKKIAEDYVNRKIL
ncbi:MAG: hypothetical protein V1911_00930, partial [Candidatus Micrarchaeota archaeon]